MGVPDALPCQLLRQRVGGTQHAAGGRMKPPHQLPRKGRAEAGAAADILGKMGVKGRGERQAAPLRPAPRRPAQRPFGGDMQRPGAERLDLARDFRRARQREANFGIGRAWHVREPVRPDDLDCVSTRCQLAPGGLQRAHHAVDLRCPGIGDDGDAHHAAARIGTTVRAAISSPQCRISIVPSSCSTKAVQLSTQSPSL